MKCMYPTIFLLLLAALTSVVKAQLLGELVQHESEPTVSEKDPILCRITTSYTRMEPTLNNTGAESIRELACVPIVQGRESDMILPIALPNEIQQANQKLLSVGLFYVSLRDAVIIDNQLIVNANTQYVAKNVTDSSHRRLASQAFGIKTVMIVRVTTKDGVGPTSTLQEMRNALTYFRNQYSYCSFGKLQLIDAGGLEVTLDKAHASYTSPSQLIDDAQAKVTAVRGLTSAAALADHVIFVQPPGVGSWLSVGWVNSWKVNVNNDFVLSLSTLMHEVGHNLGLLHSSEGSDVYGDISGYMGYASSAVNTPHKCFNGFHSWQLGWYLDRQTEVFASSSPRLIAIAATVDYNLATSQQPVLVKVGEYYLQYNRAKKFNSETGQRADQLTITLNTFANSQAITGLSVGQSYTFYNFLGVSGQSLVIQVCSMTTGSSSIPDLVTVSIGYGGSVCSLSSTGSTCQAKGGTCSSSSDCCSGLVCRRKGLCRRAWRRGL